MVTSFLFQGGSGFALTIYYQPTVVEAFPSVQLIFAHVNLGWFIKSIHRWSSGVMVQIVILHIVRVYLTGGFKKPRELIWITGIILAVTTVSFGVSGYSLPWDQVAYWGCKIVTSLPEALDNLIPGIGKISVLTLRGVPLGLVLILGWPNRKTKSKPKDSTKKRLNEIISINRCCSCWFCINISCITWGSHLLVHQ